ncbi:MAG TPA: hypothetical protein VN597_10260, partial [Streptosporangiaceae bacterium]|nr:hypothetical protein [Streptosporangiaceae bacterium]
MTTADELRASGVPASGIRVAAIDCGTNSLRLLVADVDPVAGRLTDVDRRMEIVRLGQGVDATGRLAPAALDRTLRALAGYAGIIADRSATAVRMVATSATRDAANSADFVRGVTAVLGVAPEVLTGDEEARLSFTGATAEFAAAGTGGGVAGTGGGVAGTGVGVAGGGPLGGPRPPYLVVDIGGGSTEFVLGGDPAGGPVSALSVDIGCVRLTERYLHSD